MALAGFTVLAWHAALGGVLAAVVLAHALGRAKPLRRRDLANRRQFLLAGAVGAGALGPWALQRPAAARAGAGRGAAAVHGLLSRSARPDFPVTSWVADDPAPDVHPVAVPGRVRRELAVPPAELDRGDALTATLDCTGGFAPGRTGTACGSARCSTRRVSPPARATCA